MLVPASELCPPVVVGVKPFENRPEGRCPTEPRCEPSWPGSCSSLDEDAPPMFSPASDLERVIVPGTNAGDKFLSGPMFPVSEVKPDPLETTDSRLTRSAWPCGPYDRDPARGDAPGGGTCMTCSEDPCDMFREPGMGCGLWLCGMGDLPGMPMCGG